MDAVPTDTVKSQKQRNGTSTAVSLSLVHLCQPPTPGPPIQPPTPGPPLSASYPWSTAVILLLSPLLSASYPSPLLSASYPSPLLSAFYPSPLLSASYPSPLLSASYPWSTRVSLLPLIHLQPMLHTCQPPTPGPPVSASYPWSSSVPPKPD